MATLTDAEKAQMLAALDKTAEATAETAQLLRTNAVRMDSITNQQLPQVRLMLASLVQLATESDVDTDQMRALAEQIRDDVDRQADAIAGPDPT